MRTFVLVAAAAALITAGLDACSRPLPHPLRPHKEPHAQTMTFGPGRGGEAPRHAR